MTTLYAKHTKNLFGEACIDIMDEKKNLLVSMGDVHIKKMDSMFLIPAINSHIVRFLTRQYPQTFNHDSNKYELIWLNY